MNWAEALLYVATVASWLAGIVLAVGALAKTAAVLFPPYAWYLLIEAAMRAWGFL